MAVTADDLQERNSKRWQHDSSKSQSALAGQPGTQGWSGTAQSCRTSGKSWRSTISLAATRSNSRSAA